MTILRFHKKERKNNSIMLNLSAELRVLGHLKADLNDLGQNVS